MEDLVLWNGSVMPERSLSFSPSSDWVRYAPGFFESLRISSGHIYFWEEHLARLRRGAACWNVELPDVEILHRQLRELMEAAGKESGKLRLQFCLDIHRRAFDHLAMIETGEAGYRLNDAGWKAGIYAVNKLAEGAVSDHKSNHRDIYLRASSWAAGQGLDQGLVLNSKGNIADASICNIFWLESGTWHTPTLKASCIPGIMRQFLLDHGHSWGIPFKEDDAGPGRLAQADEVILTNVVRGIRWVEYLFPGNGETIRLGCSSARLLSNKLAAWEAEHYPGAIV